MRNVSCDGRKEGLFILVTPKCAISRQIAYSLTDGLVEIPRLNSALENGKIGGRVENSPLDVLFLHCFKIGYHNRMTSFVAAATTTGFLHIPLARFFRSMHLFFFFLAHSHFFLFFHFFLLFFKEKQKKKDRSFLIIFLFKHRQLHISYIKA
jgi:hypothetical protein